MIRKYWFTFYLLLIALLALLVIVPVITQKSATSTTVTTDEPPIGALGYYSATVPTSAQSFMKDWFTRHAVSDVSVNNLTVRGGSFTENTHRLADTMYREITMYVDIKKPSVSYKVFIQSNLSSSVDPLVYITCPDANNQRGIAANCQGMTQI